MPTPPNEFTVRFEEDALLWWPQQPEQKYTGRVIYDIDDGIRTVLYRYQSIHEQLQALGTTPNTEGPLTLFASITNIGNATLFDGFHSHGNLSFDGPTRQEYVFNQGLVGAHSESPQDEVFHKVSIRLTGLEAWLAMNPFRFSQDYGETPRSSIELRKPETTEFTLEDGSSVAIAWLMSGPNQAITQTEARIECHPWLTLKWATPGSIDAVLDRAMSIIGFIETVSDQLYTRSTVELQSLDYQRSIGANGKSYGIPLYQIAARGKSKTQDRSLTPMDFVFNFQHLNDFGVALRKWEELYRRCKPAIKPYLAVRDKTAGYAETRFFLLASIAESLHRELNPNKVLFTSRISRSAIDAILQEVPEEARSSVQGKLSYLNALSYSRRLEELMLDAGLVISDVIGNETEQRAFRKQVTEWRNEQAHQTKPGKRYSSREGLDFIRTASKLKVIIDFQIYLQLGFDPALIAERMRQLNRYWFYASNKTWPWKTAGK